MVSTDLLAKLLDKNVPPHVVELFNELSPAELLRELLRIAPMSEAERLSSLSEETLKEKHAEKIERLSERRYGMRVYNALMLR